LREPAAVFAGGFLGTLLRYGVGEAFARDPGSWPWATFAVNVAGAFLLAYIATSLPAGLPPPGLRLPLLTTGFCGALTTFSTMQLELLGMLDRSELLLAAGYGAASLAAGISAVAAATALARRGRLSS